MASDDTFLYFTPLAAEMPLTGRASFDTRHQHPVIDFDDSTSELAMFSGVLPLAYGGGGLTVTLVWAASTAAAGDDDGASRVKWGVAVERLECGDADLDADSFAQTQTIVAAPAAVCGQLQSTEIALADGAAIGGLAAGESFRLKVSRLAEDADDAMSGDAELRFVTVRET